MNFRDYFYGLAPAVRLAFSERCGTSVGYLNLIASGHRKAGESLALRIERESGGQVRVESLRPDVPWEVLRSGRLWKIQAAQAEAPSAQARQ